MPRVIAGAAIALLLAPFATASAQDWPTRAVTMVVPYAAGGPVDTLGRILAARLSEILGQQVVVENVAGAGGMTGSSRVAKAPPDGYTVLLSGSAVLAINQTLYKRPLYNAVTDFEQVGAVLGFGAGADHAQGLSGQYALRIRRLRQSEPGEDAIRLGRGRLGHARVRRSARRAMGTKITHVPYRGAGPAMQDLIGRTHRLRRRADLDRAAADPGQHREGDRHARARARARPRKSRHRAGAGP